MEFKQAREDIAIAIKDVKTYDACRKKAFNDDNYLATLSDKDLEDLFKYAMDFKDVKLLKKFVFFSKSDKHMPTIVRQIYSLKGYKDEEFLKALNDKPEIAGELFAQLAHDHKVKFLKSCFHIFNENIRDLAISEFYRYNNEFDDKFILDYLKSFIRDAVRLRNKERLCRLLALAYTDSEKYYYEIQFLKNNLEDLGINAKPVNRELAVIETVEKEKGEPMKVIKNIIDVISSRFKEFFQKLDLINNIKKAGGNIMGIFNKGRFDKGYLKVLLITKDYRKMAELIENEKIKVSDLGKDNILELLEYALDNDLMNIVKILFNELDGKSKAEIIKYYYDNNFAITEDLALDNLDQFIDVCIAGNYMSYVVILARMANEKQLNKLQKYLIGKDIDIENYAIFTSSLLMCPQIKAKIMNSNFMVRYYQSLTREEKRKVLEEYIATKPSMELFDNFIASLDDCQDMVDAIMASGLTDKVKANYLGVILDNSEPQVANNIIDLLIGFNNLVITKKLLGNHLVSNGKINNYGLLRIYLENIPTIESFKELLGSCEEYEQIYNYVVDANMIEQARNKYLYLLLEVLTNKKIIDDIIEKLLTGEDQLMIAGLANNYLVVDGKIANEKLLKAYLEFKPTEKTFKAFLSKVQEYKVVERSIREANLEEKLRNIYLYDLLEIADNEVKLSVIQELLASTDEDIKVKLAQEYLVLDGKITNDELLKIYLESRPTEEDFRNKLNSVSEYERIYGAINSTNLDETMKNSYYYLLLEVVDDTFKLTIIEQILSTGNEAIKLKLALNYKVLDGKIASGELVKIYVENKPLNEDFEAFLESIEEYATVYKTVVESNLSDEEKSNYLYALISYYDIDTMVFALLKLQNVVTINKLIKEYLVYLVNNKKTTAKDLLEVYLENKPTEQNFNEFLNSVNDYLLIYETVKEMNLTKEAKNCYLYQLIRVVDTSIKLAISEYLLKNADYALKVKLANNYLVLESKIISEELLNIYLENKPTEQNFNEFLNSTTDYDMVYLGVLDANISEKARNDYLYQLLGVANYEVQLEIIDTLLATEDKVLKLKLANNYLVLEGKITSKELLKIYLENKPSEQNYKNFLNLITEYETVYNTILIADIPDEDKNCYLYSLLEVANMDIKMMIIKHLLLCEDKALKLKLANNYLVLDGKITSEELLKIYLESKPSENSYNAFLNCILNYQVVYKIIMSANISDEEKSKYLYMLISYYDMNIVIDTLLQIHNMAIINKLIRNYLVLDGKITNIKLLVLYLDMKPPVMEFQSMFANLEDYDTLIKGIKASSLSAEEKSKYLELLLAMETNLKAEDIQNLILDYNVPYYVAKITNDVIEYRNNEEKGTLIKRYLRICPSIDDFRKFLVNHNLYTAFYEVLGENKEAFDNNMMSEYLYAIFDLTDDESLSLSIVNDILALNNIEVIRRMMAKMGEEFQAIYVKQAIRDRNVDLMVTLACATDCKGTAPLVNRIINLKNTDLIVKMLYNLGSKYAMVALGTLINDPELYINVLEAIKSQEAIRVQNGEEPTSLLTICARYVFETGMDILFDSDIIAMMNEMIGQAR